MDLLKKYSNRLKGYSLSNNNNTNNIIYNNKSDYIIENTDKVDETNNNIISVCLKTTDKIDNTPESIDITRSYDTKRDIDKSNYVTDKTPCGDSEGSNPSSGKAESSKAATSDGDINQEATNRGGNSREAKNRDHWGQEMKELVDWFVTIDPGWVRPFNLEPHLRIDDPVKYFASLRRDIAAGPSGARARTGALHDDLRKLKERLKDIKL